MDVERETVVEAAVSIVAVFVFLVAMVGIGVSYGGQQLNPTGGLAIIAAIVAFVFLMAIVGVFLERE